MHKSSKECTKLLPLVLCWWYYVNLCRASRIIWTTLIAAESPVLCMSLQISQAQRKVVTNVGRFLAVWRELFWILEAYFEVRKRWRPTLNCQEGKIMCTSRKYPYPHQGRSLEILREWGVESLKSHILKGRYKGKKAKSAFEPSGPSAGSLSQFL